MSDPLAEVIAMLNLRAVLTKTIEGAGDWRVRRSDQGLSFYGVVLEGGCRLEIDQHEPQILRAGDFILIPAAYRFSLTSLTPPPSPALETIPVQLAEGHFRLGALDKPAQMQALIGHCASGSTNASLLASLLPAFVVVRNQLRLATFVGLLKEEAQADRAGKSFVLARMVELLFIEAIRSSGTLATPGLMRGLSDPRVAQAIRLLHQAPARRWTVNALAADCALSRSTLFERFTDLTGMTPMGYLLGWRMTLAMQWLSETGISIADIAERIGYGSASAFSVAFTRYTGISPGKYARQRAALNVSRPALTKPAAISVCSQRSNICSAGSPSPPPGLIKQKRLASVGEPGHGATSVPALNSLSTYIFGTSATPCWLSTAAIAISCRS